MPAADLADDRRSAERRFWIGMARAGGGAIFFAMPLLMTMEMWWLGSHMDRFRLALFMLLMIPILIGIDHYSGFKETSSWLEDVEDGFAAYGVGFAASFLVLLMLNIVNFQMAPGEILGKVALQAVPASFGAVLASSQLGGGQGNSQRQERKRRVGYGAEVFLMAVGAVFLAFNVAPTEEMILIAFKMHPAHGVVLVLMSLLLMHAFVYAVQFRGMPQVSPDTPWWSVFLRFTVVGYAVALLVSAYVLWTFGRYETTALSTCLMMTVVLGFPASLGAAAARLIL